MMLASKTSSDLLLLARRAACRSPPDWQGAAGSQIASSSDNSDPDEGERAAFKNLVRITS